MNFVYYVTSLTLFIMLTVSCAEKSFCFFALSYTGSMVIIVLHSSIHVMVLHIS